MCGIGLLRYLIVGTRHMCRCLHTPDCCELVAPIVPIPNMALDGKDVESGDTEVGKCINCIVVICKLHADGEVHTAAQRNCFRAEWLDDFTLFQIGECMACHPLDRGSLDLHVLECADKLEVGLNRIGGEMQALYIKGLKLLELGKDVNHSTHQADFCFEYDERTEDGCELGLREMRQCTGQ